LHQLVTTTGSSACSWAGTTAKSASSLGTSGAAIGGCEQRLSQQCRWQSPRRLARHPGRPPPAPLSRPPRTRWPINSHGRQQTAAPAEDVGAKALLSVAHLAQSSIPARSRPR